MLVVLRASSAPGFRYDINGLRAWAVVAVMLYHFGVPGFSGGFVGVDVFFVISGFLMTGIVVRGLERGGSPWLFIASFYMARARRILPALIVLCAVLLALGWWVLLPLDYKMLGTHVFFSLAFLSNVKFWREAGYFDAASHEKWLLHTWSLAVEWQFYLLLPLALLAVWKLRPGRRSIVWVMAAGLLVSLVLSIFVTSWWPTASFYLLPTRSWEMLAGGLVYLMPAPRELAGRQRAALEASGLLLVVGAIIGFDTASAWPGWRAIVPVTGTVAVLLAARPASHWTGDPVAQWLGTRSYSIYLWHWPLVVALTYLDWQANAGAIITGLALTLVLGHLSYRWVENPARKLLVWHGLAWGSAGVLGAVLVVAAPAAGILFNDGVAGRFSPLIELNEGEANNKNPRELECHLENQGVASPSCVYGGKDLGAILIGDSHGNAVISAMAAAVSDPGKGVMQWTYAACPFLYGGSPAPGFWPAETKSHECGKFIAWATKKLDETPRNIPVVIVNRLTMYAVGGNEEADKSRAGVPLVFFSRIHTHATPEFLNEFAEKVIESSCRLAKDRQVYLVRPIPEMGVNVPRSARFTAWGRSNEVSISLADYHQRHAVVLAAQDAARDRCGVKILDPLPYLCRDGRCYGTKDGRPLYYDDDHLSEWGNKLLVPMFAEIFKSQ